MLQLDLVYNPRELFLPGDESALEHDFKNALKEDFDIEIQSIVHHNQSSH